MKQTIAIFSPVGGIGVSTIAADLAYILAEKFETAVVDMNPDFGSVGAIVDCEPEIFQNKYPVIFGAESAFIKEISHPKRKHLKVFSTPPSAVAANVDWKTLLSNCHRTFAYTICDLPHTFMAPELFIGFDAADMILLIAEYQWASILSVRSFLKNCHHEVSAKCRLVINKTSWLPQDVIAECKTGLGVPILAELPFDLPMSGATTLRASGAFWHRLDGISTILQSGAKL